MLQILCVKVFKTKIRRISQGYSRTSCNWANIVFIPQVNELFLQDINEPADKKSKLNPCVTCFGIFDFIDEIVLKVRQLFIE